MGMHKHGVVIENGGINGGRPTLNLKTIALLVIVV